MHSSGSAVVIPGQTEAEGGGWKCSGCGIATPRRVRACDCPTNCVYRGEPGNRQHDTKTRAANSPGDIVDAAGVVEQLAVHKKTHTQWAEWFEAHPAEAAKQPDLGDAAFHRAIEAKYDAMISVVADLARQAAQPASPIPGYDRAAGVNPDPQTQGHKLHE